MNTNQLTNDTKSIDVMDYKRETPMTLNEAANFLGITAEGIYQNAWKFPEGDERRIPSFKAPNQRRYFYKSELNNWIKSKATDIDF